MTCPGLQWVCVDLHTTSGIAYHSSRLFCVGPSKRPFAVYSWVDPQTWVGPCGSFFREDWTEEFMDPSLSATLFSAMHFSFEQSQYASIGRLKPATWGRPFRRFLLRSSARGGSMLSEMKQGFPTEQVPVSTYVGARKKLKDLQD